MSKNNPGQLCRRVNSDTAKRLAKLGTKIGPVTRNQGFTLQCDGSPQDWTIFFG